MSNELKLNLKPLCHSRCCTRQRYYSLNTQSLPEPKANSGGRWLMSGQHTQSHSRTYTAISKGIILNLKRDCSRCCTLQLVPTHSHTAGHPPRQFGRMEAAPPLSPPNSHVVREDGDSPHPSPSSTRKKARRPGLSTGAWRWRLCCVGKVSRSIDGRQREKGE